VGERDELRSIDYALEEIVVERRPTSPAPAPPSQRGAAPLFDVILAW
jgi:hypothetical protein